MGWNGFNAAYPNNVQHFHFFNMEEMKWIILLDNESTTSIFCNPDLVTDIRPGPYTLGMNTNGGDFKTNQIATLVNFGTIWFNQQAMTNIIAFHEMAKLFRITCDTNEDNAFIVHCDPPVKFTKATNGLYYYRPSDKFITYMKQLNATKTAKHCSTDMSLANVNVDDINIQLPEHSKELQVNFINTVEENKKFYTDRQLNRAKKARELFHAIGTPNIEDFKKIIRMNSIKNCPVTIDDIVISEKIFGPDIGTLKGKSTRHRPAPVVHEYVDIPNELITAQENITLCIDVMHVNGNPFLTTISRNIMYRTAQFLKSQTTETYKESLNAIIRLYNKGGFRVSTIHADNAFRPLIQDLQDDFDIDMKFSNPNEHVPEAERNNRTIKERVRATFHRLPYKQLPKIMIKALVMDSAKKLNFFPPKRGVSKYYSPRTILHREVLDYDKHCKIPFGTYVLADEEPNPKNNQQSRKLDCIYLRYDSDAQNGHQLMHIPTGLMIGRATITPAPITQSVIDAVHALAEREGQPQGLKIKNKTGVILWDSAWLPGVDYDPTTFEAIEDNEEDEDEDDDYDPKNEDEENEEEHELDDDDYDEVDPNEIEDINPTTVPLHEDYENTQDEDEAPTENQEEIEVVVEEEEEQDDEPTNRAIRELQDSTGEIPEIQPGRTRAQTRLMTDTTYAQVTKRNKLSVTPAKKLPTMQQPLRQVQPPRTPMMSIPTPKCSNTNHIFTQTDHCFRQEYTYEWAYIFTQLVSSFNAIDEKNDLLEFYSFVQTYSLKQGLKKFGRKGEEAAFGEMKQLHDRATFEPIDISKLTKKELSMAMESLIFLVEKRDGRIKARACANGSTQRKYLSKEDGTSPTVMTESVLMTATIDAGEGRDVMTNDVPNAFPQTDVPLDGERIIMKVRGPLVDMLVSIAPKYKPFVRFENGRKIIYLRVLKAIYGMIQSSLLFYKKFRKDVESIGFKVNPYDPCVANRYINGKQHTITWHVDDVKSSHVDPKVNDDFHAWLEQMYGDPNIGQVKAVRGKRHEYLGMVLDFTQPGKVMIDMTDYVKKMTEDFFDEYPEEFKKAKYPWDDKLFIVNPNSPRLDKNKAETFHTYTAKGLFAGKRGRQDMGPVIAFLTTRVQQPTKQDWTKLVQMLRFLSATKDDKPTFEMNRMNIIEWYLDASFAVHPDMKSHTGATMTLGKGAIQTISTKQKINSRSSTEAELVSIDDIIAKVIWTRSFLEAQGYHVKENVIYRDNQSSMKLEINGKQSSGKRTRHFNIKYFYITDLIQRGEVSTKYCSTDHMIADYMTKPLTGEKFHQFRQAIMNFPSDKDEDKTTM
jgi:hypothetical protein